MVAGKDMTFIEFLLSSRHWALHLDKGKQISSSPQPCEADAINIIIILYAVLSRCFPRDCSLLGSSVHGIF